MNAKQFITAGNATFTLTSPRTGKHFTYKVRATPEGAGRYFVSLLTGPSNTMDYSYLGLMTDHGPQLSFRTTAKSCAKDTAPSVLAYQWFVLCINKNRMDLIDFHHMGRCGRCGRELTVPESIESGIGPECARKL